MQTTNRLLISLALMLAASLSPATANAEKVDPTDLQALIGKGGYAFAHVRENTPTEGIRREVVSFSVDDLRQYALVLWPAGEPPGQGWPVVQFNHGYHPDPPRNGFNAQGVSDRPGDYYRETVQALARAGYVTVVPDYRGHNISAGAAFTRRLLADMWYTRDAVACFLALPSLQNIDLGRAYMLGHSMGAGVTLRALLALGDRVRAGAVWSTTAGGGLDYLMQMSLQASAGEDAGTRAKPALDQLAAELENIGNREVLRPIDGAGNLRVPLSIQHAAEDPTTPVAASLRLAAQLYLAGRDYQLMVYPGGDHLFTGEQFATAVARDLAWFERFR
ncbi:alpha/beta fold hydrolase [Pseudohalioglobus sediminis]|uniref:Alpha/beta fold hydrolase n=1 Tax=Pseudohalioglobus sediminis TaxID=2606449 RepID=A0A5B0WQ30_9GAMM|nr:alpha/beta fold hydrolase [Pseudohalioglobus sediminis]KAA1189122.1 alpha/beta fold hydrolase [Pseudohalioglobus sediminis]